MKSLHQWLCRLLAAGFLSALPLSAATVTATFTAPTTVPVTAASYTATGNTVNFTLNFAPAVGTNLTVVKNTGLGFIQGTFSNLAQGQTVTLSRSGIHYAFVANYFGGTGNDLVLQWANTRVLKWPFYATDDNSAIPYGLPLPMDMTGVLAGKTIRAMAAGDEHYLALCTDGTLAAWGTNSAGQLGNNGASSPSVPVGVDTSGVLAGKTIIAIAAGKNHSMALCSDGTLAAWGDNYPGRLGNGSTASSKVPVLVDRSGVLAGKAIIAMAAGETHSLALCSDGTVAAWGDNASGQLGDNTLTNRNVPVAVNTAGVLAGKTVTAIGVGGSYSLALCADGTLVSWGGNGNGQLGNNSKTQSSVPVLVDRTGVLAGKTVTAISTSYHNLALCSDGTLAAWGYNLYGQLGNNSTIMSDAADSSVPVLVDTSGVLAGKTITDIHARGVRSFALCSDGTLAGWGYNSDGSLGAFTKEHSSVPLAIGLGELRSGELIVDFLGGNTTSFALAASPPLPMATTLAATGMLDAAATLNGSVTANGSRTTVSFEYGLTTAYGTTISATPASTTGTSATAEQATPAGLLAGTTYHYRIVATSAGGTVTGEDMTFTTSTAATLSGLSLGGGTLSPGFSSSITGYSASVPNATTSITVTPIAAFATSTVKVNNVTVASGAASAPINLAVGNNTITLVVSAGGTNTLTYTVTVSRLPAGFTFNSATTVPVTVDAFVATGKTANCTLNFAPPVGTNLTVVNNTGYGPIQGTFDNLAQGLKVHLTYGGITYSFVANYFGGTGNDLILHWANTRLLAWGSNSDGQLGNNSTWQSTVPTPVDMTGVLAGRTITATAVGISHALVLCADGTLAAWGCNVGGQLGNNSTTDSSVPVLVDRTGVLAGRAIAAISAGYDHNLVLCADGTLVTWGYARGKVPILVDQTGVLAGKTVIAVSAGINHNSYGGYYHDLVVCSDGTVATWGGNSYGQLGNDSITNSLVPVLVNTAGVLDGKKVVAGVAATEFSLVRCEDGTLASWGTNSSGQLGNRIWDRSRVPVLVNMSGMLYGKTIIAMGAARHCLVLCSDGTLSSWGSNQYGQLGCHNDTGHAISNSYYPVLVDTSGVLAGRTVVAIAEGGNQALCADGTLVAWGYNSSGQLGNNSTSTAYEPVLVDTSALRAGERFVAGASGKLFASSLVLVAAPPPPIATTLAATAITDTGATLNGNVNANATSTTVTFEYGLTTSYGITVAATPAALSGTTATAVRATLSGLLSGTTYHYRVVAASTAGTVTGEDRTFNMSTFASLVSLSVSSGTLAPVFSSINTSYEVAVSSATGSIMVTPVAESVTSTVKVNGIAVASGATSAPITLTGINTTLNIVVTAASGASTKTYVVTVIRPPEVYLFSSSATVPVTAGDFAAAGKSADFALNFAPAVGTNLTAIKNTGSNPIQGAFGNLAQGQLVTMAYGGITYAFVANYFGGTGNDLVLQWANTRMLGWGSGASGVLGNNDGSNSLLPTAVDMTGVLAGKTIMTTATGSSHVLALCADGTLAAWGENGYGQLGDNSTTDCLVPVLVSQPGPLSHRRIVAIAAGGDHSLALYSDGTLAAWGYNNYGQLGNNSTTQTTAPVLVNKTGVLSDKTIIAIAAAGSHSLALCSDGTIAGWGYNNYGQLGNNSTTNSSVPVAVDRTGVLLGKTVTALAGGNSHSLALCSDGTIATWGYNAYGQLGNKSSTNSSVPVLVDRTGALSGKAIAAIASGASHNMGLCTDGTLVSWGYNIYGQLGNNVLTSSNVPVAINSMGVLSGKTVVAVACGSSHSLALCSDGNTATWGYNNNGQLGNSSTTNSSVPVWVNTSRLRPGERFAALKGGLAHSLALVASPPAAMATTLAATGIRDTGATLNGSVNAQALSTAVSFEYGLTTKYGTTIPATPASVTGTSNTAASATLAALPSGTTYHYRVIATSAGGTVKGEDMTFTTTNFTSLLGMSLSSGTLAPAFSNNTTNYIATVPYAVDNITVTPVVELATSTVKVNGVSVASGMPSTPLNLAVGNNVINTVVAAADGINTKTYAVTVTRLPQTFTFNSATNVPVTVNDFLATGNTATFSLNYVPTPGTNLTVVNNTGLGPIQGVFSNLAQGQAVTLTYGGVNYPFVANYFGGTGNDLVLQWGNTRLLVWGYNGSGQLGNNTTTTANSPVPVDMTGVLAGKTIISVAAGSSHCLVLCAEGTVATWGDNAYGQLGNNGAAGKVPVAVVQSGVLAGKRVIAVAAGSQHNLALCSDGTLAAWGSSSSGQLGNNTFGSSTVPVLVDRTGVLSGRTVVAISTRGDHSVVLCTDGTLAAWGANDSGQLGNNTISRSAIPVLVDQTGALAGKSISCVSAGGGQTLALCTDGALAVWGGNLGDGTFQTSSTPVWVNQSGALSGKTIAALGASAGTSLILCTDGTRVGWGFSSYGLLGSKSVSTSIAIPTLLIPEGALIGKTTAAQAAGGTHILALCTDGTLTSWGGLNNMYGQLGNNTWTDSYVPVLVNTTELRPGERITAVAAGNVHSLALVASPPPPLATTMAASGINDTGATLNASVNAQANSTAVSFEYGPTTSYGTTVAATPAVLTGTSDTAASVTLSSLPSGMTYHYRIIATNGGGTARGADMTFTTSTLASLAGMAVSSGSLTPAFSSINTSYIITVPFATTVVSVTPVVLNPGSTVTVAGIPVESGAASGPRNLTVGNNPIDVEVTAADGIITKTYTVTVTRLPQTFTFNAATNVPVTVGDFVASGNTATFALNFTPPVGTNLTVVNNTGSRAIQGAFSNLAQGQRVELTYGGVTYTFVANYGGGTGNDLVLQWASTRLLAWGYNIYGKLGNNSTTNSSLPVAVDLTGVLAGKSVMTVAAGPNHSFALCADGTLAAWGYNATTGQLGNNSTTSSSIPVLVDRSGVLAGKTVIAVAVGDHHSLALCSDGTLAAWGYNYNGQLGNNGSAFSSAKVPVLVDRTGVLSGKTVIAVAAAGAHSLALCSDGTLAAWGYNYQGQLGDNSTTDKKVPVLVDRSGVLAGKTVVGIAAGGGSAASDSAHSLALCSDGTVAAWGSNGWGQLGVASPTSGRVPVLVDRSGVLAGKTVTAIAAGYSFSMGLCSDGTMAAWGYNYYGQLGNNSTTASNLPVLVDRTGVLASKTVVSINAGNYHSLALCSDGTLAAWGYNNYGQLGNNSTTNVLVPVLVNTSTLATGDRFTAVVGGSYYSLALVASPLPPVVLPLPPVVTSLAATTVTDTGATLTASVQPNGISTAVTFEYGLTTAYGSTVTATPSPVTGTGDKTASYVLGGLVAGTTYHYRVIATSVGGTVKGADMTFITSTLATLADLTTNSGAVLPDFEMNRLGYSTTVPFSVEAITVTPTLTDASSTVKVNGVAAASGTASAPVAVVAGNTTIPVVVTSGNGANTQTYQLTVTRLPAAFAWPAASSVPVTAADFLAFGNAPPLSLGHTPQAGASLMVVNNTGSGPIRGTFDNLVQGQTVMLEYQGIIYSFVANYSGGTGNDLVLRVVAVPPPASTTTLAATGVTDVGATLHAALRPNGVSTTVSFQYGLTSAYGGSVSAASSPVTGVGEIAVQCVLDGLQPDTIYHYRVVVSNQLGSSVGEDMTFTTSTLATLADLVPGSGTLMPGFSSRISAYAVTVPFATTHLSLTPTVASAGATVTVNSVAVASGTASGPIHLAVGNTVIPVRVTSSAGGITDTYTVTVTRVPGEFAFNSATDVPVTAAGFVATGNPAVITLGFAPPVGTVLTVVNNTGIGCIRGTFDNLAQGQPVALNYNGITYQFVANYYGGTGNDLVLQWANNRLTGWGYNGSGQVGDKSQTNRAAPVAVENTGVLAGKTVLTVACGNSHSIALCADGTLAAWGRNAEGQLGNNSATLSTVPVAVDMSGDLAGKTVVAVAAGSYHSLVLCSDGTLAAWGSNTSGQLGNTGTQRSLVPVALDDLGALAGKTIVAIAAGSYHNLALCEDGTIAAWGANESGQLGNGGTVPSLVPVAVGAGSVLTGKPVVAVAAGTKHNLVLCADGTLVAWGSNTYGQLGNGNKTDSLLPVMVNTSGVLAGRTPVAVAVGQLHSMALCADGRVATWGRNSSGSLGNNTTTDSSVPVLVDSSGVLANKTITAVAAGDAQGLVLCADGTLASWGYNSIGQLGNNSTTSSSVPVAVTTTGLAGGERFVAGMTGPLATYSFGLVASPQRAGASTLAATSVSDTTATLNASLKPNGSSAAVSFEYGLTSAYGIAVAADPAAVIGSEVAAASASLGNLLMGTTYHFRVRAANGGGTTYGDDRTFTTSDLAGLSGLALGTGSLSPAFTSNVTSYIATVPFGANSITVTAQTLHATSTLQVNGVAVETGTASNPLALAVGNTGINVQVTAADGILTHTYTVTVTRLPESFVPKSFVYHAADEIPVTAAGFMASGDAPGLSLDFAPAPGTNLTVVNNTGPGMIVGTFANLAQWQKVTLSFGGADYPFVVNYYGGTGNDLVLEWANRRLLAWGANNNGNLGDGTTVSRSVPAPVLPGVLAGKTIVRVVSGGDHNLALASDGTLAAWGDNTYGQLGDNSITDRVEPVAVDISGVLAGKTIIGLAACGKHSVAVCADGSVATWGGNDKGQLGDGTTVQRLKPVLVDRSGVLADKAIIAVTGTTATQNSQHCLALCTDGTLVAWGFNTLGELGDGTNITRSSPVRVIQTGVLTGKTITAIAAGEAHSAVVCSDGTVVAWGYNVFGNLGDGTTTGRFEPVAVVGSGVLTGKTVIGLSTCSNTCLVRCSDGTLATWGYGSSSQLGNGLTTYAQTTPVLVTSTGVLTDKTPAVMASGTDHHLVGCNDGTLIAWGYNSAGQLGDNSATNRGTPVLVTSSALRTGERIAAVCAGSMHSLAWVASPPPPTLETQPATEVAGSSATLHGQVIANGTATTVTFEYGRTTAYGTSAAATPDTVTGTTPTAVSAALSGLLPGTTYHYRIVASGVGGIACGQDLAFTTGNQDGLTDIVLSSGTLAPAMSATRSAYAAAVPYASDAITVTPVATRPEATVKVNGSVVASGTASKAITLAVGSNPITIVVDAGDGVNTRTYTVTVTRVPEVLAFDSATAVPVTADCFNAAGLTATFALRYAPVPGTILTVVRTTGIDPIQGTFANLAQGQWVYLPFNGTIYQFIASYSGGTGKDLVLQWANTRLLVWGNNASGQLGDGTANNSTVPKTVDQIGALAGKTVITTACGSSHSLALCSDGTIAAWGGNSYGQLGNNSTSSSPIPVAVNISGALAGKIVTAIAAGDQHSLALCSDGTLAAWGSNGSGELGDNSTATRTMPVLVDQAGVLQGKAVVAVAAGSYYSLALCGDGTIAAWGSNSQGQLGNSITGTSLKPVMVNTTGVLTGKRVQTMAAGSRHNLALCSDGTVVSWGGNDYGQLGANSSATFERAPVLVNTAGVLAGKTVAAIATGNSHCMALCTDGTLCAWGYNDSGRLGDGTTTNRSSPITVDNTWELADKTITTITAGTSHSMALCSDGTLTAWGYNSSGQLGNNSTTSRSVPVVTNTAAIKTGEYLTMIRSGPLSSHVISLLAAPPLPVATTLAATAVNDTSATLNGRVIANGLNSSIAFEYGLTTAYGSTVSGTPASLTGMSAADAAASLTGLLAGTIYHCRVLATSATGTARGDDLTFTTTTLATLSDLAVTGATLVPGLAWDNTRYTATVPYAVDHITMTPVAAFATSSVTVNGTTVVSGTNSGSIYLTTGNNVINIVVTAADGINTQTYTVTVTRLPEVFAFNSATDVPVTASGFSVGGLTAGFALNFAPSLGTRLMVLRNTGTGIITGTFANLAQGQVVDLPYAGTVYHFVANYHGGTGNDLVLEWAATRVFGWGANFGQIGNGATVQSKVPVPGATGGALSGKTILTLAEGGGHVLALGADGSVTAWGSNSYGQLGINSTQDKLSPVTVDSTGVLTGRSVIAVAAGEIHSLALCADGTLVSWGANGNGQLGTVSTSNSLVPVAVDRSGVLAGRTVTAIAATAYSSFALCADGCVAAWGSNSSGQLGNNSTTNSQVPVLVNSSGVLACKTVVAIAAGYQHSLALCSDGTLAAWGSNNQATLGNNSPGTNSSSVPVLVDTTGVLAGKAVVAMAAGQYHNLVLCADGSIVVWGSNSHQQLGADMSNSFSLSYAFAPVSVIVRGALADKTVTAVAAGESHSLALCSDGTVATWGYNNYGQLGNDTTTNSPVPVAAVTANLLEGERFISICGSAFSSTSLAITAMPQMPRATTLAASNLGNTFATLNGSVNPDGTTANVWFEYGLTNAYGTSAAAVPAGATGSGTTAVSAGLTGLTPGTLYHYRIRGTTPAGVFVGTDMTFTSGTDATLAGLTLSDGNLYPAFAGGISRYAATVPFTTTGIAVTPVCANSLATVLVNGSAVASGAASGVIPLAVGNTQVTLAVSAPDGSDTYSYALVVTRLPEVLGFDAADDVPVVADAFTASGQTAIFGLRFAPPAGTNLTVIRNTGVDLIGGTFSNLAQNQIVALEYNGISYNFVANYYGGSGNDLVLQWANSRLIGWGYNANGELGNGLTNACLVPSAAGIGGALIGKKVTSTAVGSGASFALCTDGTLTAWGINGSDGQLGNNSTSACPVPITVDQSGVLAGKTVIAMGTGVKFNFALCSDGTLAAWGANSYGQLGDGSTTKRLVPVTVQMSGALANKRITTVAGGESHTLALCADGTLAAWGYNANGRLGNASTITSPVPVAVDTSGALAGKTVMAIAVGQAHNLALCADGTLVAWGDNASGQLGINGTTASLVPVLVDTSGALGGKTVTAIAAGNFHSLALCSDGTVVTWGSNNYGQLGNNSVVNSLVPVAVATTGVLAGKTVSAIQGGTYHSLALCLDGTVAAWGSNSSGQLGNNSTVNSSVPVATTLVPLVSGERMMSLTTSNAGSQNLTIVASPLQSATSQSATAITGLSATLHGSVNANKNAVTVSFEYGLDETYGSAAAASPASASGNKTVNVSAGINGLTPGTLYHYRTVATSYGGVVRGADMTFTTLSDNAKLAGLSLSAGILAPEFGKLTTSYVATVPFAIDGVTVTPTKDHFGASVQVEGVPVASGAASGVISLPVGNTTITTLVTAEDGIATMTYTITVTRLPLNFTFHSAGDVPVSADGFAASGIPVDIILDFAPTTGTILTMVNNSSLGFIHGRFSNLTQGQRIGLTFNGRTYAFVANYFGGTGNDLVLQWADTQVMAWGSNSYGQLGDASTTRRLLPTSISDTGVLAGKPIMAVAGGYLHSLTLCSDGTLAAWGQNVYGQLGNNSAAPSSVPVAVDRSGVLAGKTVIAISAGPFHSLALCSDGTVAAWGYNNYGQLGTGDKVTSRVPVLVNPLGALGGKQVVAVAAAAYSSFALCADGTLTAWGYNDEGELGDGTTSNSSVPVAVDTTGALAGKQIASVTAGQYHTLALCTDGTLVAWGYNNRGQLGNNTTITSKVPVDIGSFGILSGKAVVATRASGAHSLALCSDGTLAAWGWNNKGQLGRTGITQSPLPLAIDTSGVTAVTRIVQIAVGGSHSVALGADGTMAAWGDNAYGQLGNNSTTTSFVPVAVDMSGLSAGARCMFIASGSAALHSLLIVGLPSVNTTSLADASQSTALMDSDHDGISDLIEYAFGLHSNPNGTGQLPQPQRIGDNLVMSFTQPAGVTGITYGAEWSKTLQPGSWTDVPDTGTGTEHIFSVPMATAPRLFMRLKVTSH
jgi:alpha-tubulin suppressor-like RCC1 family protein/phosphodiesterase/alkaline phosphatase D-like protein